MQGSKIRKLCRAARDALLEIDEHPHHDYSMLDSYHLHAEQMKPFLDNIKLPRVLNQADCHMQKGSGVCRHHSQSNTAVMYQTDQPKRDFARMTIDRYRSSMKPCICDHTSHLECRYAFLI